MYRVCIFLCTLLTLTRAQIPSLGWCPDYLPMADFDMDRFLGKWYEAERYFQFSDIASRCVVTDYARAPSGKVYVSNEVTNSLTGIKRVIDGHVDLAGKAGEGKLDVKYSTAPLTTESSLTVLDTDYDNHAVVWSCSGFGPVYLQSVWVMTRDRIAPGPVMQKAYGILDRFKISRNFFVKTDQEGCAIAASDINAANGITSVSTVAEATGQEQRNVPIAGKDVSGPPVEKPNSDDESAQESADPKLPSAQSIIKDEQSNTGVDNEVDAEKNIGTLNKEVVPQPVAEIILSRNESQKPTGSNESEEPPPQTASKDPKPQQ